MKADERGVQRMFLNGTPLFQYGPLDQGWWPDGLYTAPTDEALKYDIDVTKQLGFNMIRKHVKVEPARWYYWCDKMGILVWQDMPSPFPKAGNDRKNRITAESAKQFETELTAMIDALSNHPSIVMWVPFNEGWGQYDTARDREAGEGQGSHAPGERVERLGQLQQRRHPRRPRLSRARRCRRSKRRASPCSASSAASAWWSTITSGRRTRTGAIARTRRVRS